MESVNILRRMRTGTMGKELLHLTRVSGNDEKGLNEWQPKR